MPIAAAAMIAVPSQRKTMSHFVSVNWPITVLREAMSIIIAMMGTAATPLITGGRCDRSAAARVCLISLEKAELIRGISVALSELNQKRAAKFPNFSGTH